jgi:hypothetical protein
MDLAYSLKASWGKLVETLFWAKNMALWLVSLVWLLLITPQVTQWRWAQWRLHPAWVTAAWLPTMFVCYFPSYWATGESWIAARVVAMVYWIFLSGWFLQLTLWWAWWLRKRGKWVTMAQKPMITWVVTVLILLFGWRFISPNNAVGQAWNDLRSGRAAAFDQAHWQRYKQLQQQPSQQVQVPALPKPYPDVLFFSDLEPRPADWRNVSAARYFGVDSVAVK